MVEVGSNDKYLVIASDGVWDDISDDEIFLMSKGVINAKEFCNDIIKNALEKKTK